MPQGAGSSCEAMRRGAPELMKGDGGPALNCRVVRGCLVPASILAPAGGGDARCSRTQCDARDRHILFSCRGLFRVPKDKRFVQYGVLQLLNSGGAR
jgi:hypothetical protein